MGLDQYLYIEKFISPIRGVAEGIEWNALLDVLDAQAFRSSAMFPSATISILAFQWCKSTAIHSWFVKNCQDNVDDCRKTFIPREQLVELVDACTVILRNRDTDISNTLLPTLDALIYKDITKYTDFYYDDLEATVDGLNNILNNLPDDCEIYYQASW